MVAGNQPHVEKTSLFREYYLKLKSTLLERDFEDFEKLNSDEERINFVSEILDVENQPVADLSGSGKDGKLAKELKESGNKAFGKGDFKKALQLYTDSIMVTPQDEGTADLALTMANRSAAFYHLQEYRTAINDIDYVLSLNYPSDLKYKVFERKAKCLLALKNHEAALSEFKNTIRALDDSKLPTEKKLKMQTDIQIMLGIMGKSSDEAGFSSSTDHAPSEEPKPKLSSPKNEIYEAASDKVEILQDSSAGRYAAAASDIAAGETILVEKAHCSVLLAEYSKTNCGHCFKRASAPYPCRTCCSVVYCSSSCQRSADATYHKYECGLLETLHRSGVSVTVLMALRIVTQQNLDYFVNLKNKLKGEKEGGVNKYRSSDYINVFHLVRHESVRKNEDFFERAVMALFLLKCLQKGNYFTGGDKEKCAGLSGEEKFIGGLLLRHLQILQFNAHEISELEVRPGNSLDESKSVFIGGGLYSTLALFNHSCDPGIVRYFDGTKVVVRTVKPIKKGEIIAENYGPIYSQTQRKQRREKLKSQYWFDCDCIPCKESWPTFEEIDKKILRFRCDPGKASGESAEDCPNVLPVPVDTADFMIKCSECGRSTNLFKGLKTLQETDAMYRQASKDSSKGNHRAALAIYLEILTMLHKVLAPPFRDYLLCQQSIRKSMLASGNKYVKH